jgi:hypothetical protein
VSDADLALAAMIAASLGWAAALLAFISWHRAQKRNR